MWQYIKNLFFSAKNWFVNLLRGSSQPTASQGTEQSTVAGSVKEGGSSYGSINKTLKEPGPDDLEPALADLTKEALLNAESAKKLFERHILKNDFDLEVLCEIIYNHRTSIEIGDINKFLVNNGLSLAELATHSQKNASMLLKSRFLKYLNAIDLAKIYYAHRHDKAFQDELCADRQKGTAYPNNLRIPPISFFLLGEQRREAYNIIAKSATLLMILFKETGRGHHGAPHEKQKAAEPLQNDPYKELEISRDASPDEIKKAYRKKALKVHPDKVQTELGERFKALSEAYALLTDPARKKAWDAANPVQEASSHKGRAMGK